MHTAKIGRRLAVLAVVALAVSSVPLLAQGQRNPCGDESSRSDRARHCEVRQQTMPAAGALSVDATPNGGITVRGWNRQEIQFEAKVVTQADSAEEALALAQQVRVVSDGGRIHAEGPKTENRSHWSVSFDVMVPAQGEIDLRSTNGGISASDLSGRLSFRTTNGGISLTNVNGDVRGSTTNGGVKLALNGAGWDGEGLDVETHNGGVHLAVPEGYSAHLEAGTTNGGVRSDFPITVQGQVGKTISGDLGGGGATLRVKTTNGGVSITKR